METVEVSAHSPDYTVLLQHMAWVGTGTGFNLLLSLFNNTIMKPYRTNQGGYNNVRWTQQPTEYCGEQY